MIIVSKATQHPRCPMQDKYVRVETYDTNMVIQPHTTFEEVSEGWAWLIIVLLLFNIIFCYHVYYLFWKLYVFEFHIVWYSHVFLKNDWIDLH